MSANEQQTESRSSVKFSLNAKGEAQVEVKVYEGDTKVDVAQARLIAQEAFIASIEWLKSKGLRAA